MKFANLPELTALLVDLVIAFYPDTTSLTAQILITQPAATIDKRYPNSAYTRTPSTPQAFCDDIKVLTVVVNNMDQNVNLRNCVALRDMYAVNSTADGNGYWTFTFGASDRNDTGGLTQFTVDFDGDCKLQMGLVDYSGVPLNVK